MLGFVNEHPVLGSGLFCCGNESIHCSTGFILVILCKSPHPSELIPLPQPRHCPPPNSSPYPLIRSIVPNVLDPARLIPPPPSFAHPPPPLHSQVLPPPAKASDPPRPYPKTHLSISVPGSVTPALGPQVDYADGGLYTYATTKHLRREFGLDTLHTLINNPVIISIVDSTSGLSLATTTLDVLAGFALGQSNWSSPGPIEMLPAAPLANSVQVGDCTAPAWLLSMLFFTLSVCLLSCTGQNPKP